MPADLLERKEFVGIFFLEDGFDLFPRTQTVTPLFNLSDMRVGEVATLRIGDVLNSDNSIKSEIRLLAEQTKGRHARTVFVGQRLRKKMMACVATLKCRSTDKPLFATQKKQGLTANTLCQHFHWLYKEVGIDGRAAIQADARLSRIWQARGVGVPVLMALVGHRDISTTQRYIDVNDEMQRAAVDLV